MTIPSIESVQLIGRHDATD